MLGQDGTNPRATRALGLNGPYFGLGFFLLELGNRCLNTLKHSLLSFIGGVHPGISTTGRSFLQLWFGRGRAAALLESPSLIVGCMNAIECQGKDILLLLCAIKLGTKMSCSNPCGSCTTKGVPDKNLLIVWVSFLQEDF